MPDLLLVLALEIVLGVLLGLFRVQAQHRALFALQEEQVLWLVQQQSIHARLVLLALRRLLGRPTVLDAEQEHFQARGLALARFVLQEEQVKLLVRLMLRIAHNANADLLRLRAQHCVFDVQLGHSLSTRDRVNVQTVRLEQRAHLSAPTRLNFVSPARLDPFLLPDLQVAHHVPQEHFQVQAEPVSVLVVLRGE